MGQTILLCEKSLTYFLKAIQERFGITNSKGLCFGCDFEILQGGGDNTNMTKGAWWLDILSKIDPKEHSNLIVIIDSNILAVHQIQEFAQKNPDNIIVLSQDEQEDLYPQNLIQDFFGDKTHNKTDIVFDRQSFPSFKKYLQTIGQTNFIKLELGRFVGERISQLELHDFNPKLYEICFGQSDFVELDIQNTKLNLTQPHPKESSKNKPKTCLTIGNFDGVHIGHQYILSKVVEISNTQNLVPAVLTFDPHPRVFFSQNYDFKYLCSLNERVKKLKNNLIQEVYVAKFNYQFASLEAMEFVDKVLIEELNVGVLVVGQDFCMGKDRVGDIDFLKNICKQKGFELLVINDYKIGNRRISSSALREK